jgi:hypothetical protein
LFDAVCLRRIERIGSPKLTGKPQLIGRKVHRYNLPRPRHYGSEKRTQSDSSEPYDGHACSRPDARRIQHRTRTGQDGTSEQRSLLQRQVRINPGQRMARDRGIFGEGGTPQMMIEEAPVMPKPALTR